MIMRASGDRLHEIKSFNKDQELSGHWFPMGSKKTRRKGSRLHRFTPLRLRRGKGGQIIHIASSSKLTTGIEQLI